MPSYIFAKSKKGETLMRMKMREVIDRHFFEPLSNNIVFNKAVMYASILLQGICTVMIFTASYFRGMRRGVDITDAHYAEVTNG